mmetsp:Transcript_81082/g.235182  ORF Transcript_81082/g.235182 Transcript_81082/m.235182 type:complete len:387 (-) Transcript_81082:63-1223(-)
MEAIQESVRSAPAASARGAPAAAAPVAEGNLGEPSIIGSGPALSARGPRQGRGGTTSSVTSPRQPLSASAAAVLKAERLARQRRKIHEARHQQILQDREALVEKIQERVAKNAQERDEQCQRMLDNIGRTGVVHIAADRAIRTQEELQQRKLHELYRKYDCNIFRRVEGQLLKFSRDDLPPLPGGRDHLLKSDDPLKVEWHANQQEERLHRAACAILAPAGGPGGAPQSMSEAIAQRRRAEEVMSAREHTRPLFPLAKWEQRQHHATQYGYFTQACVVHSEGGGFHSARRMGAEAHRPDERDGVVAAGKTRTRLEHGWLGMLSGTLAKEGEAVQHRTQHGGGWAAPLQDHYHYPSGAEVVRAEFPLGRRAFPDAKNNEVILPDWGL